MHSSLLSCKRLLSGIPSCPSCSSLCTASQSCPSEYLNHFQWLPIPFRLKNPYHGPQNPARLGKVHLTLVLTLYQLRHPEGEWRTVFHFHWRKNMWKALYAGLVKCSIFLENVITGKKVRKQNFSNLIPLTSQWLIFPFQMQNTSEPYNKLKWQCTKGSAEYNQCKSLDIVSKENLFSFWNSLLLPYGYSSPAVCQPQIMWMH